MMENEPLEGVLLSGIGGLYTVLAPDGQKYPLHAQAKLRHEGEKPVSGDRVRFQPGEGEEYGWLFEILPRRNRLPRPQVANVDRVVIVLSASKPEPDLLLVDRLLVYARQSGIEPTLLINKRDQDPDTARLLEVAYRDAAQTRAVSALDGADMDALRGDLKGAVVVFCGQSGVGKSTLLNALFALSRQTGDLSDRVRRGKHTTRECELIPLPDGCLVADTPGFSLLDLAVSDPLTLAAAYPEFAPYDGLCRFQPCSHRRELGCAVRAAVQAGKIDTGRWARYVTLYEEKEQKWRDRYD